TRRQRAHMPALTWCLAFKLTCNAVATMSVPPTASMAQEPRRRSAAINGAMAWSWTALPQSLCWITCGRILWASPTARFSPGRSGRREIDELTHGCAGLQSCETLVDLGELDATGNQVIELESSLSIEGEQPRHVHAEPVAAHGGALDLPVAQEVEAMELDLH